MPSYEIAIEFKSGRVTRPMVQQIAGAAIHTRADVREVIIRAPSAAKTAQSAVADYNDDRASLKNRAGDPVRVTLALGPGRE